MSNFVFYIYFCKSTAATKETQAGLIHFFMKILVTGAAGFIGFHIASSLVSSGHVVVGLDNINDYYDQKLKYARLKELGISEVEAAKEHQKSNSEIYGHQLSFIRMDLADSDALLNLFQKEEFELVCHMAAQAGVRYSLENPRTYIKSNIDGFFNLLEACRHHPVKHLVYASSSSVYGLTKEIPFNTEQKVDKPISLYAATKKSNELMAHTYSHLFNIPTTGLRFFTVYGPWGRPDMALYLFTDAILADQPIQVFNHGEMERDFTYIDDVVEGVVKILEDGLTDRIANNDYYKLYNIGNNNSVRLLDFIENIEDGLGKKAVRNMVSIQPGDVEKTWANVDPLIEDYNYSPGTSIEKGVRAFLEWYKQYHNI